MQTGTNVDVVLDLTTGTGDLSENYFDLIICCSVLEHVRQPWIMAENLTKLLKPGGHLFMSVPWIWRYHAYPDDYYRFSPSAIKALFPGISWGKFHSSTREIGKVYEIPEDISGFDTALQLQPVLVNSIGEKTDPITL
jgi:SAM-dependent methyltransferase